MATAAYFQADGIGELVSAHLVPREPPALAPVATDVAVDTEQQKSAGPILARNAFDSVTGPLDGRTVAVSDLGVPNVPVSSTGDPYKDPACDGISSSLVTAAEDPAWSFASMSSSEGTGLLRRRGDKLGNYTIHQIGWLDSPDPDYVPRVWLTTDGSTRCLVGMGAIERGAVKTKPPADDAKPAKPKSKLAAEIGAKITKVGENQFLVERSAVEQIIQNYAKLAGSLRSRQTAGGLRVSGIKKDSILGELGMKNGDLLENINGFDMADPEKAVDAYAKLRTAGKLAITVNRDDKPFTIDISIK